MGYTKKAALGPNPLAVRKRKRNGKEDDKKKRRMRKGKRSKPKTETAIPTEVQTSAPNENNIIA